MTAGGSSEFGGSCGLVSVIVCTYNRCDSLRDTMTALAAQETARETRWELIVVDNNSSDGTAAVVRQFRETHPGLEIHYLFERQQGLSHARNLGLSSARGELILFTDDDVLPEPNWLQALVDAMRTADCDAGGGYISPLWEAPPPRWLTERFHGFLAIRMDDTGPKKAVREDEFPFGANMAFRRRVFEKLGTFDPSLGRTGSTLAGGEEIDLFSRVQASGGTVMYFPQARVRHKVEAFRLTKAYFRRWRFQGSRTLARLEPVVGARTLLGVPAFMIRQLMTSIWRAAIARVLQPADIAFRQEMIVWHFLGVLAGIRDRQRMPHAGTESSA